MAQVYTHISNSSTTNDDEGNHPLQVVEDSGSVVTIEIDNENNENNNSKGEELENNEEREEKQLIAEFSEGDGDNKEEEEIETEEDEENRNVNRKKKIRSMLHLSMGLFIGLTTYLSLIGLQSMISTIKDSLFSIKGSTNTLDGIMLTIFVVTWGCLTLITIAAIKQAFDEVIQKITRKKHYNNNEEENIGTNRMIFVVGMCIGNIISTCIVSIMLVSANTTSSSTVDTAQNHRLERNYQHLEATILPTLLFAMAFSFVLSTFHNTNINGNHQQQGLSLSSFLPWHATANNVREQRQMQLQQIQLQQIYSRQSRPQSNTIIFNISMSSQEGGNENDGGESSNDNGINIDV